METPSSTTRRVTRSQTLAALNANTNNNIPISNSEKGVSKSRKRSTNSNAKQPLIDITNDSPIVGVATSGTLETPSSSKVTKQRSFNKGTPGSGSGETLLRGQVKSLLQRVEEEAELSKLSLDNRPFLHLINSPMRLLALTPANTPQILNLDGDKNGLASMNPSPVVQEQLISQVVSDIFDGKKVESVECDKNLTRSLLLDFSEKMEFSNSSECSSVVTYQGGVDESFKEKSSSSSSTLTPDDDHSSTWSIQTNASSSTHDDEEDVIEEEEDCDDNDDDDYADEEEEDEGGLLDELCEGVSRISMPAEATGKHTRFMYNSDEEIVEECEAGGLSSPSVLRLQGLPTPKGKHLRFPVEEEGSD